MAGRSWGLPAAPLPAGRSAREPRRRRCPFVPGQQPRAAPRASWGRHTSSHWFLFLFLFLTDDEGRGVVGRLSPEGSRAVPRAAPAGSLQSPGGREHYRVAFFFPLQSHVGFPTRCPADGAGPGRASACSSRVLGPRPHLPLPLQGLGGAPAGRRRMSTLCPSAGSPRLRRARVASPPCPRPTSRWPRRRRVAPVDRATLSKCPGFSFLLSQLCCAEEGGRWPGPRRAGAAPSFLSEHSCPHPRPRPFRGSSLDSRAVAPVQYRASCASLFF